MASISSVYYGSVVNTVSPASYDTLLNCLIGVNRQGDIEWIVDRVPVTAIQDTLAQKGCPDADTVILSAGEFIIPGFIDTHTVRPAPCRVDAFLCHLVAACSAGPEYRKASLIDAKSNLTPSGRLTGLASGQQYQLLDWLTQVTFPMEAKFADEHLADGIYKSVVKRFINSGVSFDSFKHLPPLSLISSPDNDMLLLRDSASRVYQTSGRNCVRVRYESNRVILQ